MSNASVRMFLMLLEGYTRIGPPPQVGLQFIFSGKGYTPPPSDIEFIFTGEEYTPPTPIHGVAP